MQKEASCAAQSSKRAEPKRASIAADRHVLSAQPSGVSATGVQSPSLLCGKAAAGSVGMVSAGTEEAVAQTDEEYRAGAVTDTVTLVTDTVTDMMLAQEEMRREQARIQEGFLLDEKRAQQVTELRKGKEEAAKVEEERKRRAEERLLEKQVGKGKGGVAKKKKKKVNDAEKEKKKAGDDRGTDVPQPLISNQMKGLAANRGSAARDGAGTGCRSGLVSGLQQTSPPPPNIAPRHAPGLSPKVQKNGVLLLQRMASPTQ